MRDEEIEVKIRILADNNDGYLEMLNGIDGNVYISTDVDQRQISINVEKLRSALRKISAK